MNPRDDTLAAALLRHQIELPAPQVALLEHYCRLLWEWNAKLNLTRHTDYEKFVTRDLVDSLAFPGSWPRRKDPRRGHRRGRARRGPGHPPRRPGRVAVRVGGKKARAVADIVERLGLRDARPSRPGRGRAWPASIFNTLVVRAVARLKKLLEWFRPHWGAFDRLLVLKGPSWVEERGEARHSA